MFFFFFNDTATTEIYTLSLHDALPISRVAVLLRSTSTTSPQIDGEIMIFGRQRQHGHRGAIQWTDRKSTRLNSSHANISYAVFCLKKKKKTFKRITDAEYNSLLTSGID